MVKETKNSRFNLGLVPRILIAIIIGVLLGQWLFIPDWFIQVLVTLSTLFSSFLNFIIPLMIIGLIVKGISDLADGAGKLLGLTVGIAYGSTLLAGSLAYLVGSLLLPLFITSDTVANVAGAGEGMEPFFSIPLEPMVDVTAAIIFAFLMGLGISWLKGKHPEEGAVIYSFFSGFEKIIMQILRLIIIPLLPIYILGNFADLSRSGAIFSILSVFWRVFLIVIALHLLYLFAMFLVAGGVSGKNPFFYMKNQVRGYTTALGTQSSAATIPVNVEVSRANGVSKTIGNFVVPLCATIHLAGSMITITMCALAVTQMYGIPVTFTQILGFIAVLGIAMVAAPGAPGGAIMSALPFLPMVGIVTDAMQQLMISLYITQDSFGTAANVSGDNAIAVYIDEIYKRDKSIPESQREADREPDPVQI